MVFKNEAQLKNFIMSKCVNAVNGAKTKVHNEFSNTLNTFYSEFNPEEYIRTYALLNSLESDDAKRSGNQYGSYAKARVYFNTPSYQQGLVELQHTPEHGMYGWATHSGEEVLNTALTSSRSHGGHISGTPIWTVSMRNLGGKKGISNLIKQELKKQGL